MSAASRLAVTLRAWVRLACAVVVLVGIAAPAALGPAFAPVLRQLGEAQAHVCKCGMAPGKCGCPECADLERERLSELRHPSPVPVLKSHCDDEAPAMPLGASLPAAVLAAARAASLPVPRGERLLIDRAAVPPPSSLDEPPTPPPRIASA